MEMPTNQNEVDVNIPQCLKERESTSSFWSPLKAIPITSFYKLHRAPSFTPMAEPELAGTNGDALSHTEPLTSSGPEGLVPPNGVALPHIQPFVKSVPDALPHSEPFAKSVPDALPHSEPFVKSVPDEQVPPHRVELPRSEPLGSSVREEQVPPNGIHNKLLEQVIRTPGRQPSPLPTHLSIPGPSHHRVLREEGPGYVAPKFEGKEQQMEEGTFLVATALVSGLTPFF